MKFFIYSALIFKIAYGAYPSAYPYETNVEPHIPSIDLLKYPAADPFLFKTYSGWTAAADKGGYFWHAMNCDLNGKDPVMETKSFKLPFTLENFCGFMKYYIALIDQQFQDYDNFFFNCTSNPKHQPYSKATVPSKYSNVNIKSDGSAPCQTFKNFYSWYLDADIVANLQAYDGSFKTGGCSNSVNEGAFCLFIVGHVYKCLEWTTSVDTRAIVYPCYNNFF